MSNRMEATDQIRHIDKRQRKRRQPIPMAELFTALEGLLPFAQVELDCLADYVRDFPDDPDHVEDAERVRRGNEAIEFTNRLIARKTYAIRRKQRALGETQGKQPVPDHPPAPEESANRDV
jgi:hypothetical protein